MKQAILWTIGIGLILMGGCWTCQAGCRAIFQPPSPEEQARIAAESTRMMAELKNVSRGDFLISHSGNIVMVRQVSSNSFIQITRLGGTTHETFDWRSVSRWAKEIVRRDDPRWHAYLDHMLFGDKVPTSQPTNASTST